ncbi:hypothetical protein ASPFODRAFT_42099 [Aspergillus luchuensis CBS 106.47]|uniref:DUF1593-domain-containing protein n=1 Tax=Aspergillus luchuensis (strain CBS 106.47) TaxID=1137211 RepID=A0A1M3TQD2_ASPLC|nr:hypothetical protein ASPFODRAFT_42099 [Aspergillus luchuensis CBS 106.47]
MRFLGCLPLLGAGLALALPHGRASSNGSLLSYPTKPRIFIMSDIANEPDDSESLVRYLVYSNQFQNEGIVAVTSTWLKDQVRPDLMLETIDAYAKVVDNLNKHAPEDSPYPSAEYMRGIVSHGLPVYGMEALKNNNTYSPGAELLIKSLTNTTSGQPLWVLSWGGDNVLAQALLNISLTYSPSEAASFRSNLWVYTISDQDDTGAWIRNNWPEIHFINSMHAFNQYGVAAWSGISGEINYEFDKGGPDSSYVTHEWLKKNIRIGPLGAKYPDFEYIMEGDSPTLLYMIQNGLGDPEHPNYGSWGGRYAPVCETCDWDNHYSDTEDQVIGMNNETFTSNKATIWRWREAYQNDFAARMQWTLSASETNKTWNHHPVVVVNGAGGLHPVTVNASVGAKITLDAGETYDPDGDGLSFEWFQYLEPSTDNASTEGNVADLNITTSSGGRVATVKVPTAEDSCDEDGCQLLHLILRVKDTGNPPLTTYRRTLIQVSNSTSV